MGRAKGARTRAEATTALIYPHDKLPENQMHTKIQCQHPEHADLRSATTNTLLQDSIISNEPILVHSLHAIYSQSLIPCYSHRFSPPSYTVQPLRCNRHSPAPSVPQAADTQRRHTTSHLYVHHLHCNAPTLSYLQLHLPHCNWGMSLCSHLQPFPHELIPAH